MNWRRDMSTKPGVTVIMVVGFLRNVENDVVFLMCFQKFCACQKLLLFG
jgi:hypothetical protein